MKKLEAFVVSISASMMVIVGVTGASASAVATDGSAVAKAPFPSCGDHFVFHRSGKGVGVTGVDLRAFLGNRYGLVHVAANGKSKGRFTASPSGAHFHVVTSKASKTDISISLTNDSNTQTLCAKTYFA